MKKKTAFLIVLWWVVILFAAGTLLLIVSDKRTTESNTENRYLQGFPEVSVKSVTSGRFMSEFENFLSDKFFARDGVVGFTDTLVDAFSLLNVDEELEMKNAGMEAELTKTGSGESQMMELTELPDEKEETSDTPAEIPDLAEATETENLVIEEGTYATYDIVEGADYLISDKKSYMWYERTDGSLEVKCTYSKDKLDIYASTLKRIQSFLPEDGVVCFTQVPQAAMADKWRLQKKTFCGWGSSMEDMLEDCLSGTDRIYVFNTYSILKPYVAGETPMFYYTDHHWTSEGAHIVLSEMLKKQGLPVIPYEEYEYHSLRSAANEKGVRDYFNVPETLLPTVSQIVSRKTKITEIQVMNYKVNTYRAFICGTQTPWRRFYTGADTGRSALVICDSFGNALAPYLFPYYDEVHMCDFRPDNFDEAQAGGKIGVLIEYFGIDDVYIITSEANGLGKNNSIVNLKKIVG